MPVLGFPGGRSPNQPTQFVLPSGPFQDGVLAVGMLALAVTQLVLIEGEPDAVRINHNQRLLFGRAAAAAATPGAPWYLWQRSAPRTEPEEYAPAKPVDVTPFRAATTVLGIPSYFWVPSVQIDPEEDPKRVDQNALHRYRRTYQTVGQSYRMWPIKGQRLEAEEFTPQKPVDLTPFRSSQAAAATPGQPFFLWPQTKVDVPPDEDARRSDQTLLHRYRTGFQTVGQPWYLWPKAVADQTPEPDAQRYDHTLLHRYRVGYQTVGQSWQYWIKPQQRVDAEDYAVPAPANLYPYRQITIAALPGQPWFMWPKAIAGQDVEPNPVVINHALALYPFLPHQAVTPIIPVNFQGGGDDAPKKRKKRFRIRIDEKLYIATEAQIEILAREMGERAIRPEPPEIRTADKKLRSLVTSAYSAGYNKSAIKPEPPVIAVDDDDDDEEAILLLLG